MHSSVPALNEGIGSPKVKFSASSLLMTSDPYFTRCAMICSLIFSYVAAGMIPRVVSWFFAV